MTICFRLHFPFNAAWTGNIGDFIIGSPERIERNCRNLKSKRRAAMERSFSITHRYSAGNLHILLKGEFNGMCAWELIKIIRRNKLSRRVFVSTKQIHQLQVDGIELFQSHMTQKPLQRDWLYFKGKRGFKIAPDGSRVLVQTKAANQPVDPTIRPLLKTACAPQTPKV
jgi:hypothetical protein